MRIAIASSVAVAVEALQRILSDDPSNEIAWIARNGASAVELCARDTPDLVLMDLAMPVMDGVEATRRIMAASPCAVLVVTATVSGNTAEVFEAMGYGALDAVNTPVLQGGGRIEGAEALLAKVATIARLLGKANYGRTAPKPAERRPSDDVPPVVAIGASTGGPKALSEILRRLPASFPASIMIVQHVDARFAGGMAEWLTGQSAVPVRLVAEGTRPVRNSIWLAGTNDHLIVRADLTLGYTEEPRLSPYRPSADVFFKSLAARWPRKGTAVLLTGMGRDGAEGLLALRRAGWHTVAQDESTCIVYGMPKAAAEIGAAVQIAELEEIAALLANRLP